MLETLSRAASDSLEALSASPFLILDNVSSIRSGAAFAASSTRGKILKGSKFLNFYTYFKYIFLTIPVIFVSPNVYLMKKCVMSFSNKTS
jgi:hypothetical protein